MTIKIYNPKVYCILLGDQLYDVLNSIMWTVVNLHRLTHVIEYTMQYLDRDLILTYTPDKRMEDYILIRKIDA